jgi:transposase-like protein
MDTTYFGKSFGVIVFKDAYTGRILYKQYVKHETNQLYSSGITNLQDKGFVVKAIVCDGRKGLLHLFENIPIQLCQFHQIAIITRYLTRNPKQPAAIELRQISLLLSQTDKESFIGELAKWHTKWESYLSERTKDPESGKSHYTHQRLRRAYRSLETNLKWLFTWYDHIELKIPNTTNALEGQFADLKNKLRNHNGLSKQRKMKFIDEFLKA